MSDEKNKNAGQNMCGDAEEKICGEIPMGAFNHFDPQSLNNFYHNRFADTPIDQDIYRKMLYGGPPPATLAARALNELAQHIQRMEQQLHTDATKALKAFADLCQEMREVRSERDALKVEVAELNALLANNRKPFHITEPVSSVQLPAQDVEERAAAAPDEMPDSVDEPDASDDQKILHLIVDEGLLNWTLFPNNQTSPWIENIFNYRSITGKGHNFAASVEPSLTGAGMPIHKWTAGDASNDRRFVGTTARDERHAMKCATIACALMLKLDSFDKHARLNRLFADRSKPVTLIVSGNCKLGILLQMAHNSISISPFTIMMEVMDRRTLISIAEVVQAEDFNRMAIDKFNEVIVDGILHRNITRPLTEEAIRTIESTIEYYIGDFALSIGL